VEKDINMLAVNVFNNEMPLYERIFESEVLKKDIIGFLFSKLVSSGVYTNKKSMNYRYNEHRLPSSPLELRELDINMIGLSKVSKNNSSLGFEKTVDNCKARRNELIKKSVPLIKWSMGKNGVLRKIKTNNSLNFDDVFQEHLEKFCHVLSRFNPKKGTFATYLHRSFITYRHYFFKQSRLVYVPKVNFGKGKNASKFHTSFLDDIKTSKLNTSFDNTEEMVLNNLSDKGFLFSNMKRFGDNSFLVDYAYGRIEALLRSSNLNQEEFIFSWLRILGFNLHQIGKVVNLSRERVRQIVAEFFKKIQRKDNEISSFLLLLIGEEARLSVGIKDENNGNILSACNYLQTMFYEKGFGTLKTGAVAPTLNSIIRKKDNEKIAI